MSIGLSVGGEAVAGVVRFNPALVKDELYAAASWAATRASSRSRATRAGIRRWRGRAGGEGYMLAGRGEWRFGDLPPVPNGTQLLPVGSIAYRMALLASGSGLADLHGAGAARSGRDHSVAAGAALLAPCGGGAGDGRAGRPDGEALRLSARARFNRRDPAVESEYGASTSQHARGPRANRGTRGPRCCTRDVAARSIGLALWERWSEVGERLALQPADATRFNKRGRWERWGSLRGRGFWLRVFAVHGRGESPRVSAPVGRAERGAGTWQN